MDKFASNTSAMVFTLTEDAPEKTATSDDWERDLQALRHNRQQRINHDEVDFLGDEPMIEVELERENLNEQPEKPHTEVEMSWEIPDDLTFDAPEVDEPQAMTTPPTPRYRMPVAQPALSKKFNDAELDEAYHLYLQERVAAHNARLQEKDLDDDVGVLMQEDWLQAQAALKTEIARNRAEQVQTLILRPQNQQSEEMNHDDEDGTSLPDFAVQVYALPEMPATRRVKVLSEQQLLNSLRDKLTPHLSHAVAGMVRQILQKKLATLSYELQIQFNEETPQVVQEVLEYHLDSALRTVKHQLREK